jgi:hypothetical protein
MASLATGGKGRNPRKSAVKPEPVGRLSTAVHAKAAPRDAGQPANVSRPVDWLGIQAVDSYRYFDTIGLLCHAIPTDDLKWLETQCGHIDIRTRFTWAIIKGKRERISRYHPYIFRIEAQLPNDAFLQYFASRNDHLYRADPALDCNFDNDIGKDAMFATVNKYLLQPYQRKSREHVHFPNGGISTGRRSKGHYVTFYADMPCRIDGVVDCFHIEHRTLRRKALADIGLEHPRDLLTFDHDAFWGKFTQSFFRQIDRERLGLTHANRVFKEKRRTQANPDPFYGRRSKDHWLGSMLYRIHAINNDGDFSVEQFLRMYRPKGMKEFPSGIAIQLRMGEMRYVDTLQPMQTKPMPRRKGPP